MRTGVGDTVILCDDQTGEWAATVTDTGKREIALIVAQHLRPREPVPDLWLCPALLKKDRFDLILEKATELGVAAIRPVVTHRCVADKLNGERGRSIITEAAEQCARTALPALAEPVKLDRLLADWRDGRALFFADEEGGEPAAQAFTAGTGPAAILTGPEGGFDDGERAAIRAHPAARLVSLGPRILRGETATIAAVSLWMGIAGDWSAHGDCLSGAAS
jgi:16S rRNA (uracil1498-N3)-methyltransferase